MILSCFVSLLVATTYYVNAVDVLRLDVLIGGLAFGLLLISIGVSKGEFKNE